LDEDDLTIIKILVITDLGELDFYQAQAVVGARTIAPQRIDIIAYICA
jgi:hypothetical protein